ncbi:MAG: diguanylate cyclase domain-containing protein [Woeseiaceae bacterium]
MNHEPAKLYSDLSPIDIISRAGARSVIGSSCPQHFRDCLLRTLDATPGLVMVSNRIGRLHYLNAMGRRMLGISPDDNLVSYRVADLYAARAFEQYLGRALPACISSGIWHGETTLIDRDGREVPVSQLLVAHRNEDLRDRDVTMFSSIAWDMRDQKRREQALRHQATHDALTGLPNRELLLDRLDQAIHGAQRHGYLVGVLFLDLDNFKAINDDLGHEAANVLLRELGQRLESSSRAEDTVARYGGDEFVLLIPDLAAVDDCARISQHISKALGDPFLVNGRKVQVKASVGVAIFPDDGEDAETLLQRADSTMYRSKRDLRGRRAPAAASRRLRSVVM